jgi:16S rRNA (adenine1518-N6/adenine1519-N6)-dimethyltransferase
VVRSAFAQRRKILRNAWHALGLEPARLAAAAERAGIDLSQRGEALSVEAFARMSRELESK